MEKISIGIIVRETTGLDDREYAQEMTLIDWQGSGGGLISYTRDCSPGIEFLNGTSAATLLTHFSDHFTRLVLILQGNSGLNLSSNRNHHLKSQQLTSCKLLSDRIKLPLFSTVFPSNICMFLSRRPFVVITTLSTGLVDVEVLESTAQARRQK